MQITNNKIKKTLKWAAIPLLLTGAYMAALGYWSYKWDTPNQSLPAQHLTNQDMANVGESYLPWAEQAQTKMKNLAEELQSVSISGAMTKNGKLIWAGAVGLASVDQMQAANVSTQYRIGSVSKPLTAIVLMRLVEQGVIDLDAPISRYLPHYTNFTDTMTTRHLLSHMSGVRHYGFDLTKFPPTDGLSNVPYEDAIAALAQFERDNLLFEPGQGFQYSTHGYTLLSAVMQAASGIRFEALIQELLAAPLGLKHTQAEHLLKNKVDLAEFYISDNGLYGLTPPQNLSNKVAGGGIVSTPTDLVTIGAALLDHSMLNADTFDEMVRVQPMLDGSDNPQYYALGWRHYETSRILDEDNKVDIIHHGGVSVGANAYLMLVPEHDISVAILTNSKGERSRGEIQKLAYQLASMMLSAPIDSANMGSN